MATICARPPAPTLRAANKRAPSGGASARTEETADASAAAEAALQADTVFHAICDLGVGFDVVKGLLGMRRTCRALLAVLQRPAYLARLLEAAPAGALAERGAREALRARWRRLGYTSADGPAADEFDRAFVGACKGCQLGTAQWLLAPGAVPRAGAIDEAALGFAACAMPTREFAEWLFGGHNARPSLWATADMVVVLCGRGLLGIVEVAYRAIEPWLSEDEHQGLLLRALEAASESRRNGHVVMWANDQLQELCGFRALAGTLAGAPAGAPGMNSATGLDFEIARALALEQDYEPEPEPGYGPAQEYGLGLGHGPGRARDHRGAPRDENAPDPKAQKLGSSRALAPRG